MESSHIRENTCCVRLQGVYPLGIELFNPAHESPNAIFLNCLHVVHRTCIQQCENSPLLASNTKKERKNFTTEKEEQEEFRWRRSER